jgi:DNA-binding CsgD family transcriptional regulator/PAS domain-containing protein
MRSDPFMRAVSRISEAALAPESWPAALQAISDAVGALGVGSLLLNKQTGDVEWMSLAGLNLDVKDYIDYYGPRDPYRPVLQAASSGNWVQLSKCLPQTILRSDEWYNGYILKGGIRDIIGTRLFDSPSCTILLSAHLGIYQERFTETATASLRKLFGPLSNAARLHAELRELGWKSAAAVRALDQLARGVIITDGRGGVIEVNRAAEQILRRNDGLTVRQGKLCAERVFEHDKLARFIALAADGKTAPAVRPMLVGRRGGRVPYVLTVVPLGVDLAAYERPLAMILIADPDARSPPERDLAELFGLSPAESRLTVALLAGKTMREIATDFGVQITTLRTQLSSVLRKVGVSRQAELIRVLANIPVVPLSLPEGK